MTSTTRSTCRESEPKTKFLPASTLAGFLHSAKNALVSGLKGKATLHSCRDTYATRMLNRGMRLEEVSHLLGHATVTQTQKYAKFAKRDVADRAREIMNGR
ncbi:tyrosine-type recombinase/integrase [Leisingera sp. JC11]|uniref:tyrosine-type recombinase/integrase n=1 Tax=Leisingera sp. JC11 TaxID=3042469 RepID=UPI0034530C77